MYNFDVKDSKVFVNDDENQVAELSYLVCEGTAIVNWVEMSDELVNKLLTTDNRFMDNFFSLLKNIGNALIKELSNSDVNVSKVLWGDFPEIKEFDRYAKGIDNKYYKSNKRSKR